jgi:hypothetical protein
MYTLVYDLASKPEGLSPADFMKIFNNHGVVLWDSNKGGTKPKLYNENPDKERKDLVVVDLKGKEIDFDVFEKEYLEKEKWDKELHRCINSPLYYFKNYAATTLPVTSDKISKFLKELGLDDLTIEDNKDSEINKEKWEKQKDAMKKAMSFIDIEHLKSLKASRELVEEKFNQKTRKLEKELEHLVDLKDSEGNLILERKRIINLTKVISKIRVIPEEFSSYEFKKQKGRWDKAMLGQTPYYNLLVILKSAIKAEKEKHLVK